MRDTTEKNGQDRALEKETRADLKEESKNYWISLGVKAYTKRSWHEIINPPKVIP